MQRPPSGRGLPLAPSSPIHDSINRISAKQTELTKLGLSADQHTSLREFVERAFAASALTLAGLDIAEEQVAALQKALANEPPALSGPERKVQAALNSIRVLQSVVDQGAGASLTPDLLLQIHDPFRGAASGHDQHDTVLGGGHETA